MRDMKHFYISVGKWALLICVFFTISYFMYGYTPRQTVYALYNKAVKLYSMVAYGIEDTSERISITVTDPNYHINATADTLTARPVYSTHQP